LTTPRQKLRRGRGLRKINGSRRVLFQVTFKTKRFCIAFNESYPSMNALIKTTVWRKKILPLACMVVTGCPPHSWYTSVPFHIAVLEDGDHLRGKSLAEGEAKKEPLYRSSIISWDPSSTWQNTDISDCPQLGPAME
jgi:hypothetical protein